MPVELARSVAGMLQRLARLAWCAISVPRQSWGHHLGAGGGRVAVPRGYVGPSCRATLHPATACGGLRRCSRGRVASRQWRRAEASGHRGDRWWWRSGHQTAVFRGGGGVGSATGCRGGVTVRCREDGSCVRPALRPR
jgi:hypothetical protein